MKLLRLGRLLLSKMNTLLGLGDVTPESTTASADDAFLVRINLCEVLLVFMLLLAELSDCLSDTLFLVTSSAALFAVKLSFEAYLI